MSVQTKKRVKKEIEVVDWFELVRNYVERHYREGYVAVLHTETLADCKDTSKVEELLKFFGIDYLIGDGFVFKQVSEKGVKKILNSFKNVGYIVIYRNGKFFVENT